ncbi:DUF4326 domain-containing protein [Planotetraspora sp. A-T 1434]|uniref:DUF4326 domain-containing protein n=1 Tax=Planotetraspora sp. A-T 1434 TaxID=2979219 RepID=UPI0021BE8CE3|nr:DUF4326 domain-containing protein [Planotetraspora sp. A-T 1434]MCT9932423.1 DUF4326 domain-containing protein [Planotetraspora sp. A-T 1434]
MPERIQRRRTKGWRLPKGAVIVDRSTRFGNPFTTKQGYTREECAARFETYLIVRRNPTPGWTDVLAYPSDEEIRRELGGRDLACWCPLPNQGEPDHCHATVLLPVANEVTADA